MYKSKLAKAVAVALPVIFSGEAFAQLEEVIVTAQKRAENVQDVPIAITNISAQSISEAGINDIADLTSVAPSLNFTQGSSGRNSSLRIRGLGTDSFNVGIEPSVSIVVDGVVQSRPGAVFANLTDIERIEVLRGPQGTLFGKNSSTGVLNVITQAPNLEEFEGRVDLLAAEDSEYSASAMFSGPMTDTLAFRINAFYKERDGLVENVFSGGTLGDVEHKGVSGKLLWQASDTLEFVFSADTYTKDSNCCGNTLRIDGIDPNATVQTSSGEYTGVNPGENNLQYATDMDTFTDQEQDSYSVLLNWDIGEFTVTSITAYTDFLFEGIQDRDASQAQMQWSNNRTDNTTFSQELRLASPAYDNYDYVVGLFYYDSEIDRSNIFSGWRDNDPDDVLADGTLINPGNMRGNTFSAEVGIKNIALFSHLNFMVSDNITLYGGLRWLREEQDFAYEDQTIGSRRVNSEAISPITDDLSDDQVIGKIGARYDINDESNVYFTFGTGYKGPAYRAQNSLNLNQVAAGELSLDPETSDSYELGYKSRLFDNLLQLNIALYHVEYTDFQAQAPDVVNGGNIVQNIGTVVLQGLEVEFDAEPIENLRLSGGITLTDNEVEEGFGGCYAGQTEAQGCVDGVQDLSGGGIQNSPETRFTLSARYEFDLAEFRSYVLANYLWQDEVNFFLSEDPNAVQGDYGILDLTWGLIAPDEKYKVSLFVKNVLDEQYVSSVSTGPGNAGTAGDYFQAIPRNFERYAGVNFSINF